MTTPDFEKQIEKYELLLKKAHSNLGDITLKAAHKAINAAAHSIEKMVVESNHSFLKPRAKFLLKLASRMRNEAEDVLGPQPGYSPRKTIPKLSS